MAANIVELSPQTYKLLSQQAQQRGRLPHLLADELLSQALVSTHPHINIYMSRSGPRPVIKGTRTAVSIIVGYQKMGYSPEAIIDELLPQLTPAQVYDALSYYHDYPDLIDQELAEDDETLWLEKLKTQMESSADFNSLTGQTIDG